MNKHSSPIGADDAGDLRVDRRSVLGGAGRCSGLAHLDLGGGSGFTVIYGVAAPVLTPLIVQARKPSMFTHGLAPTWGRRGSFPQDAGPEGRQVGDAPLCCRVRAARQPQDIDTGMSHLGFRCVIRGPTGGSGEPA